jgi:hypothetical protein
MRQVFTGNAPSGVLDLQQHSFVIRPGLNNNGTSSPVVVNGVGDQVGHHLPQLHTIASNECHQTSEPAFPWTAGGVRCRS